MPNNDHQPTPQQDRPRCAVHHMPRNADTWMLPCTCPSTAHGEQEEAD